MKREEGKGLALQTHGKKLPIAVQLIPSYCPTALHCSFVAEYVRNLIWERIEKLGQGNYQCRVCGLHKTSTGLTALKNHIESKHLGNAVTYKCQLCDRVLNSSNAYHSHMHSLHKKNNAILGLNSTM